MIASPSDLADARQPRCMRGLGASATRRRQWTRPVVAKGSWRWEGRRRPSLQALAVAVLALTPASCGQRSSGCRTRSEVDPPRVSAIERVELGREAIFGDDHGRLSCTAWLDAETLLGVGDDMLLVEIHVPSRTVRRRRMSGPRDFTGNQDVQAMAVVDGRHVAFGTLLGSIVIFDLQASRFVGETSMRESDGAVYACAWRGPSQVLAAHIGGRIVGFKLPGLEEVEVEPDAHGYVDFGPGGHVLIPWGAGRDAVLLDPRGDVVWRRAQEQPVGNVRYLGAASSDGRFAAMGRCDEFLHLADALPTRAVSWYELRPRRAQLFCESMAFVPGARELVVKWSAALEVFDAETRASLAWLGVGDLGDSSDLDHSGWPRQTLSVSSAGYVAMREPHAAAGVTVFRILRGDPAGLAR